MAAAAPSSNRWLYGPAPDLLLGCGALYLIAFAVFALAGPEIRGVEPIYLAAVLMLIFSVPHYGGTLVRVYEHRADRRGYVIFSLWSTLFILTWFVAGLHVAALGSLMLTVYLSWSPWHYTGQNYGIAVMFLRRRGVDLSGNVKRWLYASFTLSFVLVFFVMHEASGSAADIPVAFHSSSIRFLALGIPTSLASLAIGLAFVAYLVAIGVTAVLLLRRASARDILPVWLLTATQALWFTLPLGVRHLGWTTGIEPLDYDWRTHYFFWIATGHSLQYLWVTSYYARASAGWNGYGSYLAKTLLAGNLVWTLPVVIFAPDALGTLSYDAGLAVLVAATVNLHHFILDGAIWKLRSSRVAGVLIRSGHDDEGPERTTWLRPTVWLVAAVLLTATGYKFWESYFHLPRAFNTGQLAAAERGLDRLAWIAADDPHARVRLGRLHAQRGELNAARAQYERAIALQPLPAAYDGLAQTWAVQGQWQQALEAYEAGLAVAPDHTGLLSRTGAVLLQLDQPERAQTYLERAVALDPDGKAGRQALDEANRRLRYPTY